MKTSFIEAYKILKERRSVRNYLAKEIPREVIQRILEVACWAPSAHNAQPWRFVVITDPETKRLLALAMGERWGRDLQRNGLSEVDREELIQTSIKRFSDAPVIVMVCLSMQEMDRYEDEVRQLAERVMAIQSVAAAIQNLLLAAHIEELSACWYCAPLFCPGAVRRILGIPEDITPQALITVGYPDEKPIPPLRKSLKEVTYLNRWGYEW